MSDILKGYLTFLKVLIVVYLGGIVFLGVTGENINSKLVIFAFFIMWYFVIKYSIKKNDIIGFRILFFLVILSFIINVVQYLSTMDIWILGYIVFDLIHVLLLKRVVDELEIIKAQDVYIDEDNRYKDLEELEAEARAERLEKNKKYSKYDVVSGIYIILTVFYIIFTIIAFIISLSNGAPLNLSSEVDNNNIREIFLDGSPKYIIFGIIWYVLLKYLLERKIFDLIFAITAIFGAYTLVIIYLIGIGNILNIISIINFIFLIFVMIFLKLERVKEN